MHLRGYQSSTNQSILLVGSPIQSTDSTFGGFSSALGMVDSTIRLAKGQRSCVVGFKLNFPGSCYVAAEL
ncbi:hypothetical protein A2U01_0025970 [Trifolium medium]|uniref:Uncharacterized protein n=1 Tax=Trifolium medium TaxID=97028 RepID=A0A392NZM8_9FABA|nr:hypothetical protein [Trifolium medium]